MCIILNIIKLNLLYLKFTFYLLYMEIMDGYFDKIYHIADIHIRNTLYHHEEYVYVFNELYKYID